MFDPWCELEKLLIETSRKLPNPIRSLCVGSLFTQKELSSYSIEFYDTDHVNLDIATNLLNTYCSDEQTNHGLAVESLSLEKREEEEEIKSQFHEIKEYILDYVKVYWDLKKLLNRIENFVCTDTKSQEVFLKEVIIELINLNDQNNDYPLLFEYYDQLYTRISSDETNDRIGWYLLVKIILTKSILSFSLKITLEFVDIMPTVSFGCMLLQSVVYLLKQNLEFCKKFFIDDKLSLEQQLNDYYKELAFYTSQFCSNHILSENTMYGCLLMAKRIIVFQHQLNINFVWLTHVFVSFLCKYPQHLDFVWQEVVDVLNNDEFPRHSVIHLPYDFLTTHPIRFHDFFIYSLIQASFLLEDKTTQQSMANTLSTAHTVVDLLLEKYFFRIINASSIENGLSQPRTPTSILKKAYTGKRKSSSLNNSPFLGESKKAICFSTPQNKPLNNTRKILFPRCINTATNCTNDTTNSDASVVDGVNSDFENNLNGGSLNVLHNFIETVMLFCGYPQFPGCMPILYLVVRVLLEKIQTNNYTHIIEKAVLDSCQLIFKEMNGLVVLQKGKTLLTSVTNCSNFDCEQLNTLALIYYLYSKCGQNTPVEFTCNLCMFLTNKVWWECSVNAYMFKFYFNKILSSFGSSQHTDEYLSIDFDDNLLDYINSYVKKDPSVLSMLIKSLPVAKDNIQQLVAQSNTHFISSICWDNLIQSFSLLLEHSDSVVRWRTLQLLDQPLLFHQALMNNKKLTEKIQSRILDTCWMVRFHCVQLVGSICLQQRAFDGWVHQLINRTYDVKMKVRAKASTVLSSILMCNLFSQFNYQLFDHIMRRLNDEPPIKTVVLKMFRQLLTTHNHDFFADLLDNYVAISGKVNPNKRLVYIKLRNIFQQILHKSTNLTGDISLQIDSTIFSRLIEFIEFLVGFIKKNKGGDPTSENSRSTLIFVTHAISHVLRSTRAFSVDLDVLSNLLNIIALSADDYLKKNENNASDDNSDDNTSLNTVIGEIGEKNDFTYNSQFFSKTIYALLDLLYIFTEQVEITYCSSLSTKIEKYLQMFIDDEEFCDDLIVVNKSFRVYALLLRNRSHKNPTHKQASFLPKSLVVLFNKHYKIIKMHEKDLSHHKNRSSSLHHSFFVIAYFCRHFSVDQLTSIAYKCERLLKHNAKTVIEIILQMFISIAGRSSLEEGDLRAYVVECLCLLFDRWPKLLVDNEKAKLIFKECLQCNTSSRVVSNILRSLLLLSKSKTLVVWPNYLNTFLDLFVDNTISNPNLTVRFYTVQLLIDAYHNEQLSITSSIPIFVATSVADPNITITLELLKELYKMDSVFMSLIKVSIERSYQLWNKIKSSNKSLTSLSFEYSRTNFVTNGSKKKSALSLFQPVVDIISSSVTYNTQFKSKSTVTNNNRNLFLKILLSMIEISECLPMKLFIVENLNTINHFTKNELNAIYRFFDVLTNTTNSNFDKLLSLHCQLFFHRKKSGIDFPEFTLKSSCIYELSATEPEILMEIKNMESICSKFFDVDFHL